MDFEKIKRNIKLFYFFELFREALFWGPILITFLIKACKMSLPQIYIMEAVIMVLVIFLEIPTGSLADLIGRKKTILIGSLFIFFYALLFAIADNIYLAWAADIAWAIGFSLISGADSSFLYDSLLALGRENEFKKIRGKSSSFRLILIACSSIFSGYLYEINLRLPMILSIGTIFLSLIFIFLFKEPPISSKGKYNFKKHFNLSASSILFVANHKKIKWLIIFSALIAVASKVWFFTYNPYFEAVGVPLKYFGWIFFLLNIVAAFFSFYTDWVYKKIGDFNSVAMIIFLISFPILLQSFFPIAPMALMVLLQNVVRGYFAPFSEHLIHEFIDSEKRATIISVKSAVVSFFQAIGLWIFSFIFGAISLFNGLKILGSLTLFFGIFLVFLYPKIFKNHKKRIMVH